jgi:hypothetical protein
MCISKGVGLTESALDVLMSNTRKRPSATPPARKTAPQARGGWSSALFQYIESPESCGDSVYYYDKEIVVIHDKFPKARIHFLVMPRQKIPDFSHLTTKHLPLLRKMFDRAQAVIAEYVPLSTVVGRRIANPILLRLLMAPSSITCHTPSHPSSLTLTPFSLSCLFLYLFLSFGFYEFTQCLLCVRYVSDS